MTRGIGGKYPANITHHLEGTDFPATRADLEKNAKNNGAEDDVLDVIRQMPDQEYGSMSDVTKGIGEVE